jgi:hypothetical protein
VDGLPLINGEPDLLRLWLVLYRGDLQIHINAINAAGIMANHKFQLVTEHEYVKFGGCVLHPVSLRSGENASGMLSRKAFGRRPISISIWPIGGLMLFDAF